MSPDFSAARFKKNVYLVYIFLLKNVHGCICQRPILVFFMQLDVDTDRQRSQMQVSNMSCITSCYYIFPDRTQFQLINIMTLFVSNQYDVFYDGAHITGCVCTGKQETETFNFQLCHTVRHRATTFSLILYN